MRTLMNLTFFLVFLSMTGCSDNSKKLDMRSSALENVSVKNLGDAEQWGRWTVGTPTIIKFDKDLPENFKLTLQITSVFGPNYDKDFIVIVGDQSTVFRIKNPVDSQNSLNVDMDFYDIPNGTNIISIVTPSPISPKEIVSGSQDTRKLGLGLASIQVDSIDR